MNNVIFFDYFFTNFLNKFIPHNIFFDYLFSFFSLKGSSIFIWLFVIVLTLILEERKNPGIAKRDKKFIILFSVSFLVAFLSADVILKNIFLRPRPLPVVVLAKTGFLSCPKNYSFPSAHAATAFAAATVLTFFDKKRHRFYYAVAILISYSRIYLNCHYFFDVVFGALLGYLISKLILRLIPNS